MRHGIFTAQRAAAQKVLSEIQKKTLAALSTRTPKVYGYETAYWNLVRQFEPDNDESTASHCRTCGLGSIPPIRGRHRLPVTYKALVRWQAGRHIPTVHMYWRRRGSSLDTSSLLPNACPLWVSQFAEDCAEPVTLNCSWQGNHLCCRRTLAQRLSTIPTAPARRPRCSAPMSAWRWTPNFSTQVGLRGYRQAFEAS